ncbi:MAG: NFACT family protein [Clostridiales bacterium]|nr:NFACT family protein [Clostridiales bacterium]
MSMNGLALRMMVEELATIEGGKIDKVQQPDKDTVVLHVFAALHRSAEKRRLLININHENGRVQLTETGVENPAMPPAFCMVLRKHLIGARIIGIVQEGWDRVLRIALRGKDALGDAVSLELVVELTGRHGNILLLREGRILDCIRHIGLGDSVTRPALPGLRYVPVPPREGKRNPFDLTETEIAAYGAERLYTIAEGLDAKSCARMGDSPFALLKAMRAGARDVYLHPQFGVLLFPTEGAARRDNLSAAYDEWFAGRDHALRMRSSEAALRSTLESAKKRVERKLALCLENMENAARAEEWRRWGELLASCGKEAPRGADRLAILDYYCDPPADALVPIDPAKSARENAKAYFKKYRKAKAAREYAERALDGLRTELRYLEELLFQLSVADSAADLAELRAEMVAQGYVKADATGKRKDKPPSPARPLSFVAPDGTCVSVGKNNLQNEGLTRAAKPSEWWLHAKDMPGSHVIIHAEAPTAETLHFAARLAAHFSAGRQGARVAVDCTQRKYVKKPAGAKPGFVIYTNQQTYYVEPMEAL